MTITLDETKAKVTEAIAKYGAEIAGHLGGSGPSFEVDWDSFEAANNQQRVWRHLTSWTGWYTFGYVEDAIRDCVNNYDGQERLSSLTKIIFRHVNDGKPRDERVRVEDNELIIEGSCCCYYHWVYRSDVTVGLVINYELFDGYVKKIDEAAAEASTDSWGGITCETDYDTFDFTADAETEFEGKKLKAVALKNASSWSGYYSWRPVRWAGSGGWYADYTDEEKVAAFSKIVIKCKRWQAPPEGVSYWWHDQSEVKYGIESRVLTIKNCYAAERYSWHYAGSWDIRRVTNQVLRLYRFGKFEEMDEEQHTEKIDFLRSICTSWEVRSGNLEWLRKVLNYPCFYPKDQHERNAARIVVEFVNTEGYRKDGIREDTKEDERQALVDRGLDPETHQEELIGQFLVTKINWKGMEQDRLIVVTDMATYTSVPKYKGKLKKAKKLHRISHQYYSYVRCGEIKSKTAGGPSVEGGKMPGKMPNMPDLPDVNMPDLPDVNMPDGPDINLPDGPDISLPGRGGFRGPPWAMHYFSSRLRKEEAPPKKFKMPKIPDLKEKICDLFSKLIDAIKSVEMPSMPKPSMPKLTCPDLLGLFNKCKPGGGDDDDDAGSSGGTTYSPYACAADLPPASDAGSAMGAIEGALNSMDLEEPEVEESDPKVPGMLTKILDKIKSLGDIEFGLPDAFNLVGILKMIGKTCGKLLGAIPLPKPPSLSPADAIQKIMDKIEGMDCPSLGGSFPSLPECLARLKEDAANMGAAVPRPSVSLPGKFILQKCIDILTSVKLPKPDIDFAGTLGVKLPGLPSAPKLPGGLPGAPKLPGIGGKAPKVKMAPGPKKSEYVDLRCKPILKKSISGASRFVCLEMAYVIMAGAGCYARSWRSGVTEGDIEILVSFGSSIYNKLPGFLASSRSAPSKPSGDGDAAVDEDGDEA